MIHLFKRKKENVEEILFIIKILKSLAKQYEEISEMLLKACLKINNMEERLEAIEKKNESKNKVRK